MGENPFESSGKQGNVFDAGQKKRKGPKIFLIIIVIILVLVIIFAKPISKEIKKLRLQHTVNQIMDGTYDGDYSEFEKLVNNEAITLESATLGEGESITLTPDNASYTSDSEASVDEGNKYEYGAIVKPGVYTVTLEQGADLVAGRYNDLNTISYTFGLKPHDDVITQLYNVPVTEDETYFVESPGDFKLELTPQEEYVKFDANNLKPGLYTGGVNIDAGTYSMTSKTGEALNYALLTDDKTRLVDTEEYSEIELKVGDSIVVDNENLVMELQQ